jgi:hypothetical protein
MSKRDAVRAAVGATNKNLKNDKNSSERNGVEVHGVVGCVPTPEAGRISARIDKGERTLEFFRRGDCGRLIGPLGQQVCTTTDQYTTSTTPRTNTHTRTRTHTHTHTRNDAHTHTHTHAHANTRTHAHTHMQTHASTSTLQDNQAHPRPSTNFSNRLPLI